MKALAILALCGFIGLSLITWFSFGLWAGWWYPRNYEASLLLADDASLPETKAQHLKDYLVAVNSIKGPPRYIFTRPDLDLAKQRIILEGLIKRFEDVAAMEPSNLAYQQGMTQLTGQEIDHQMERISHIFKSAKLRESPMLFLWLTVGALVFPLMAIGSGIGLAIISEWQRWKQ